MMTTSKEPIVITLDELRNYGRCLRELIDVKHQLSVARHALYQAQEAAKQCATMEQQRGHTLGLLAVEVFGMELNNVSDDELLKKVRKSMRVLRAARSLSYEGEEYSFDDIGLGRGAPNSYWEDLDDALEDFDEKTSE